MIDKLRRVAVVLLLALLLSVAGLYLWANFGAVASFSQELLLPVVAAMQRPFTEPEPVYEQATEPPLAKEEPPPIIEAFEEPTAPPEENGEEDVRPVADFGALPYFVHEDMLNLVPEEVERIIYILGSETSANLWLAERHAGRWRTAAGPLACRIGDGGLRRDKSHGDTSTPIGWLIPSYLYAGSGAKAAWPIRTIGEGYAWVVDPESEVYNSVAPLAGGSSAGYPLDQNGAYLDLGYNRSHAPERGGGVFLFGADQGAPTQGAVALSTDDMERVVSWLDVEKYTAVGIFRAEAAGWTVEPGIPNGFDFLTSAVPGAREDARYAGYDNFLGRPLSGYLGTHVIVSDQMAAALRKAQAKLEQQGFGLLVYDSYRPQRAVDDIFSWLDTDEPGNKENYYPELDKSALSGRYLAEYSLHRRGAAVDLTLCVLETGEPLDMGTGFDFFSPLSAYNARGLTAGQAGNRKLLRTVMRECGLTAYDGEWWHFNLPEAASQNAAYDFVIPQ